LVVGTENGGGMTIKRYVALGDSFTEGVGDPDSARPNGVRGWADQVAEALAKQARKEGTEFRYANLAIRGRKLDGILKEQINPAVSMAPDLITIYAGANDIMRPKVDIDALINRYEAGLVTLAGTGARLLVWTAFDPAGSAIFRPLRGRFALYSELVRWAAEKVGAEIVDFWRFREYRDWGLWDPDRLHMGPLGHQQMAHRVLDQLAIPHDIADLGERDPLATSATMGDLAWTKEHLLPWLHRRITGRSSGDNLSPRRPTLTRIE
jgi:lysophospholipase L1-like esterase